jgi:hypothetical protein
MKIKIADGIKTFRELMQEEKKEHKHHYRYVCVECGRVNTCKCPAPKVEIKGICELCEEGIPKNISPEERLAISLKRTMSEKN